jgi:hypothetical protein
MKKFNLKYIWAYIFIFQIISLIPSVLLNDQVIKYIEVLNKTHFLCDTNKILKLDKFNDDFCDCDDGVDENSKWILKY